MVSWSWGGGGQSRTRRCGSRRFFRGGEDGDGAGELLVVDFVLNGGVEAFKALGGEADRLGLDGGHVDGRSWRSRLLCARGGNAEGEESGGGETTTMRMTGRASWFPFWALLGQAAMFGNLYIKSGNFPAGSIDKAEGAARILRV